MTATPHNTILTGDAAELLAELAPSSVDCLVTSPPYYQLRNYAVTGQLGVEATIHGWVAGLRRVFAEASRVLTPTGAVWLNLGDSFSRHRRYGTPPKSLLLAPERLLLALALDGWIVRNKVVWAKTNPMPTSVTDRLAVTYEMVYFLVRQPRYFFDLDAIREPHRSSGSTKARAPLGHPRWAGPLAGTHDGLRRAWSAGSPGQARGKNPGDVWRLATRGFPGAHFATFPPALIRRPILATCPERVCAACGTPTKPTPCGCGTPTRPGLVLDPFFGTGTVGLVAQELGRDWLGIELNPAYVRLAEARLGLTPAQPAPLSPSRRAA